MSSIRVIPRPTPDPFPRHGIHVDHHGSASYLDLPATLTDELLQRAEAIPDAEAVVEVGGRRLTYADLVSESARVAGGLRAEGLTDGTRVAITHPAGVDWAVSFFGILSAGGIVVAVNTRFTAAEVAFVLEDAGVARTLGPGRPAPAGAPYTAGTAGTAGPDDVAALFYTSGTTGRPKGVPTTHRAFLSNSETMVRCLGIDARAGSRLRTLISVPMFHVTGCNAQFLTALHVGGTSVVLPALDLPVLLDTIAAERISFLVTVPAVYALMLRHPRFADTDVTSVRWAAYGGAPIPAALVAQIMTAFPAAEVINGFGLTETASITCVLPHADAVDFADSVGYAAPVVDLALDRHDGSLGPDLGELLVRGPNVAQAYWNGVDPRAFDDGWLHTGDIVRVDEAGRVYVVDRLKDIINRGGENVSSIEVENALAALPGVLEAAVVAVPDDVLGEKVGAVLVAGPDGLDAPTLMTRLAERLADYKVPQYVEVRSSPLPRNAGGKVLKSRLRETAEWGTPLR